MIRFQLTVFLFSALITTSGKCLAQDTSGDAEEITGVIARTAADICGTFDTYGFSRSTTSGGEVEAQLGVLKKLLAGLGVEGAKSLEEKSFSNVLQEQLGDELVSVRTCRLAVWQDLHNSLFGTSAEPSSRPTTDGEPPTFFGQTGKWIGWGNQGSSDWAIEIDFESDEEAKIGYPSIPCSGILRLLQSSEREAVYREILLQDARNCVNSGIVSLSLSSANTMEYSWSPSLESEASSVGTLERIAE